MSEIKNTTDATFEQDVLRSGRPVVVDFWAPWCGPCRMIAPELAKLAEQYGDRISFVKLNVDENPFVPSGLNIMSIPTIAFFRPGQAPRGVSGFRNAADLEQLFGLAQL